MIDLPTLPRLMSVASTNATARLADLRQELETTGDWPKIEVSAALLLADVCHALGLNDADLQTVLGADGLAHANAIVNTPIRTT